ncbi:MAG TPA: DUF4255 domain-containing protein [Cyclobacteriaceae bacterium]|jgi:uncharacterized protein DUF4255|nr:DUF4255 domain-containing protein [Cyclobacteriaceae bacterium]
MSTSLRIASVTYILKDLLNNGLINHDVTGALGETIAVTALPPDRVIPANGNESTQLNLFMYQVTPNPGWRNLNLPSFNGNGERIANPALAIDLHYLLTAYGSGELHTEILLGYGMQLLHEVPVLDRESIRRSIAPPSDVTGTGLTSSLRLLSTSSLAEQAEMIKITPELLSIEDISKLWAAFGTKYRPTAAYKVTVVLIESTKSAKQALPVKERNIYLHTLRKPEIETVGSRSAAGEPVSTKQKILNGYFLVISGKNFSKQDFVTINGNDIINPAIEEQEIEFQLPDGLKAGIQEVQITHPEMMGSPPSPHKGSSSNSEAFVLSPTIVGNIQISNVQGTGDQLRSATITFKVSPKVQPGQKVIMILNEKINSPNPAAYSFEMLFSFYGSPPDPIEDISIDIKKVKKGDYLVMLQIDGALSPLTSDVNGNYVSPIRNIP